MPDRSQWPHFELGFKVFPPLLGRRPGRPKVVRIRGCLEKKQYKEESEMSKVWRFWTLCQDMQGT